MAGVLPLPAHMCSPLGTQDGGPPLRQPPDGCCAAFTVTYLPALTTPSRCIPSYDHAASDSSSDAYHPEIPTSQLTEERVLQLEEATIILLQNLHGLTDGGVKQDFTVQVLLKSSERFGPASIRELSVQPSSPLILQSAAAAWCCLVLLDAAGFVCCLRDAEVVWQPESGLFDLPRSQGEGCIFCAVRLLHYRSP